MLPTDYIRATFKYGASRLILHRADGDSVSIDLPPTMCIRDVEQLVRDDYDNLPLEIECATVFGLLVSIGKF